MADDITSANNLISNWFTSDEQFNQLYPAHIRSLASKHWTPIDVAVKAARFLAAEKKQRILDIGSGVGKFCLAAAYFMPDAVYTGVEQRPQLTEFSDNANAVLKLPNVHFLNDNFTKIDFSNFDHFYFYNSFYENFSFTTKIDNNVNHSSELYHSYAFSLRKLLAKKPAGTRLATFHSLEDEIPDDFLVAGTDEENTLKFWIKV